MNRPDHTHFHQRHPDSAHVRLSPARPGVESLRPLPLLGATLLLLGALLYGPRLEAWQHTLVVLVLVTGGAALALRAVLESGRLPSLAPLSAEGPATPAPSAPRPLLRLITPAAASTAMPAVSATASATASTAPAAGPAAGPIHAADGFPGAAADPLTGSYSQQECRKMLALMFVRASRFHSPLALVMVRVEQLERIGAMFGAAAADTVLVELAAFLQHQVRGSDVVARWDDAGFALLLPGTAQDEADELAARLRHLIGHTFFAGFSHLSCAIGVADSRQHRSAEALANAAVRMAMPVAPSRPA